VLILGRKGKGGGGEVGRTEGSLVRSNEGENEIDVRGLARKRGNLEWKDRKGRREKVKFFSRSEEGNCGR